MPQARLFRFLIDLVLISYKEKRNAFVKNFLIKFSKPS